ncbi:hypothetical protein QZM22_03470 [Burkholderia oklahomensis]|uniref:Wzt carbohydrate-binding domain-containing protein n=1 Tax=Burkholderia oklahomensis TaxID=342113 RepID=UPI002653F12E|nr:Wzt carbohydrate-binding domain-containing protein [Burkholderia oklahomensis]MDN7671604.1 hypothetical protein [Burkholderia oklahomensis]
MKEQRQVFAGRVIFDHLPKTAGQAVNAWLSKALGAGCVTPNLIGRHRDLIRRYGGEYSVISAHVSFQGMGLDPRYQYLTCLREPIDRAISWLFFVMNNHEAEQLPELWEQAGRFAALPDDPDVDFRASVGRSFEPEFVEAIRNPYVEHFAAIAGVCPRTDDEKIAAALASVEQYDVWGFYEAMPAFLSDVAALIGLPAPQRIDKVNATRVRPDVGQITPSLRKHLETLNALDIEFYRVLRERRQRERAHRTIVAAPEVARWQPYEPVTSRACSMPEFSLVSATLEGGDTYSHGQILRFAIVFSIDVDVAELGIGIQIMDEDERWAFGSSNSLLNRPLVGLTRGTYCMRYYLAANLPEGQYVAGFVFSDSRDERTNELAYYEKLVPFQVVMPRAAPSVGYMSLPVDFDCQRVGDVVSVTLRDATGRLQTDAMLGQLTAGETFDLPVCLENASTQTWVSSSLNPIHLSYRWLDVAGQVVASAPAPEPMPLPVNLVAPGEALALAMRIVAPGASGRYRLVAMPAVDGQRGFDAHGFTPLSLEFTVTDASVARVYRGADIRLYTQIGLREAGAMTSAGQEGFLLFGPYASLPAGRYVVSLEGRCDTPDGGWMDVTWGRGAQVLKRHDVTPGEKSGPIAEFDFELPSSISDLEVRVWVPTGASVRVDTLRIEPLANQQADAGLAVAVG